VDGLWFADIFGLSPPKGKARQEVIQLLIKMTSFPCRPFSHPKP